MDAFQGLVKAITIRTKREASGKALNGMQFDSYFDSFLTTMAAMSPAATTVRSVGWTSTGGVPLAGTIDAHLQWSSRRWRAGSAGMAGTWPE